MARIQLTPPGTPDLSWSPSSSTGKGPFFFPASLRSRRFLCGLIGLVGGCALLVTLIHIDSTSYLDRVSQSSKAQLDRVWQQIGALDTLDSVTQPCERTLLWKFSGKSGFGSEYGMFLRAATYAKENSYTLLTASRSWDYGDYEDYFEKPVLNCAPPPGTDDPDNRDLVLIGSEGWQDAPHLIGSRYSDVYHALDEWLMDTQIDTELMKKLSPLNLDVPLPYGQTVPPGVAASLALENSVMHSLWRPKPRLYEMVEELKHQLQLVPGAYRGHVIGVHYRGGDKLVSECPWPVCGNATALLQSALDMIPHLPEPTCPECKPRIALMTIEPDALELFRASPLATHFTIDPLPPPPGGLRGHTQKDFNQADENEILDDTFAMLRDIAVLSLNADGFVVSANSNVGVVALVLGGPGRPISSVDFRFKATTRPLSEYFTGELTPGAPGWKKQAAKAKAAGKPHIGLSGTHR